MTVQYQYDKETLAPLTLLGHRKTSVERQHHSLLPKAQTQRQKTVPHVTIVSTSPKAAAQTYAKGK